jgi:hypothetical protein
MPVVILFHRRHFLFRIFFKKGGSTEIISVDAPTEICSNHGTDDAEDVSGHEPYLGACPPSKPAEDCYADYHEKFFHFFLVSLKLSAKVI